MEEIQIKDIELLNKTNQDILELERKIEELKEIKELKKLQQKELELKKKINKFSRYDSRLIGNVIAKLMTQFEGIKYYCSKNCICDSDYIIDAKEKYKDNIYPNYKIRNIKQERHFFDKKEICFLPPSIFNTKNVKNKDLEYIQLFIDYLYEIRSSKLLDEISENELDEILNEFIEKTKDLQIQRRVEIDQKINEIIIKKQREKFEKSCVIDRKLIFNSLAYVINNYEENMNANQEYEEEWSRYSQWSELTGYHKLIIKSNEKELCFKTKVDSEGCYPDEEYCGVYVDLNKNTNICFFDIKKALLPMLKNSNYAINFMNGIEEMYLQKQNITSEAIELLLVNIINEKKAKKKNFTKLKN